jgi:hypothetical protein
VVEQCFSCCVAAYCLLCKEYSFGEDEERDESSYGWVTCTITGFKHKEQKLEGEVDFSIGSCITTSRLMKPDQMAK